MEYIKPCKEINNDTNTILISFIGKVKFYYTNVRNIKSPEPAFKFEGKEYYIDNFLRLDIDENGRSFYIENFKLKYLDESNWMKGLEEFSGIKRRTRTSGLLINIDNNNTDYIKIKKKC